jgi:hypothetical protein
MDIAKLALCVFACTRSTADITAHFRVGLHSAVSLKVAGFVFAKQ